jgi:hypothetical protein
MIFPFLERNYDLYLAGAMSGVILHNYPTFIHYANELRKLGYSVWNPAEFNNVEKSPQKCMKDDINAIINKCDNIAILPGNRWRSSIGVNTEINIAHVCGKKVFQIIDRDGVISLKRFYTRDIRSYCYTKDRYRNDSIYSSFLNPK